MGHNRFNEGRDCVGCRHDRCLDVELRGGISSHRSDRRHRCGAEQVDCLVCSEDLDEVLGLADRVAVMFEGRIVGVFDRDDCTVEQLGLLMAGASA